MTRLPLTHPYETQVLLSQTPSLQMHKQQPGRRIRKIQFRWEPRTGVVSRLQTQRATAATHFLGEPRTGVVSRLETQRVTRPLSTPSIVWISHSSLCSSLFSYDIPLCLPIRLRSLRLVTVVFHHRVSFVLRLISFHQLMTLSLTIPLLLLLHTVSSTLEPRI
ncbi:hypothetical protein EDB83DRAFT_2383613 [Lactarius deliciosus]|nr:hypothetical protein EDB83DRAFT_2383613 [Lactarius deliciosus]